MYVCMYVQLYVERQTLNLTNKLAKKTNIRTHTRTQTHMYLYHCREYTHTYTLSSKFATHSGQHLRYHSQNKNSSNLAYLYFRDELVISKILAELPGIYHCQTADIEWILYDNRFVWKKAELATICNEDFSQLHQHCIRQQHIVYHR